MRAIWFCYVMLLISLATGMLNEWNELHVRDKGYPLIPVIVSGSVYTDLDESTYNTTISRYGLDAVPGEAGENAYLGTGGTLLGTYNAFQGVFQVGTLGLNTFVQNLFPAIPLHWLVAISAIVTLNNVYAAITFIRGVSARWL